MKTIPAHMKIIVKFFLLLLPFLSATATSLYADDKNKKLNVLMIAVDDLKPALGCAGDPLAKTPNIDKLAANGTVFNHAYCQQAVCSPSRSSLMTGRRPDTTKVYDLQTHFRKALPEVVTLTQHFKNNGYYVQGMGKIFHSNLDDKPSWSVPWEGSKAKAFGPEGLKVMEELRAKAKGNKDELEKIRGIPFEKADCNDEDLQDGWIANRAQQVLKERKEKNEPFFLAVGFVRPHLPFSAPKKYWDMYDASKFPIHDNAKAPKDAPAYAGQQGGELRQYVGVPKTGLLPSELKRNLVHGYYASVSFMDAQVGKVLDALKENGQAENTIVILWGDHGWHLGDHAFWCKHTNFEQATRSAMVVSSPLQKAKGQKCDRLVEFVDIFPTLTEACQLPQSEGLEGYSFTKLLDDPKQEWKRAAFSQYPRQVNINGNNKLNLMGYAVRTERYRYVEWKKRDDSKEVMSRELYDLQADPEEIVNIANDPKNEKIVRQHAEILADGWQKLASK